MLTTCIICFDNCNIVNENCADEEINKVDQILLQRFCQCFGIPLKNIGIQWDSNENIPFCDECKKTATQLVHLNKKVKLIQKTLKTTEKLVKRKIQSSSHFSNDDDDSKDVRVKILRDLIVLPHISLTRINSKRINRRTVGDVKSSSSSSPPAPHYFYYDDADLDDAYFDNDDYSPHQFNENSILEPDENSSHLILNSNHQVIKIENSPNLDEQLNELQQREEVENGDESFFDIESDVKFSVPLGNTGRKRKRTNKNRNSTVVRSKKKLNRKKRKTQSNNETVFKSQQEENVQVIDEFEQSCTEDLNIMTIITNSDNEQEEESFQRRRPRRKTTEFHKKKYYLEEEEELGEEEEEVDNEMDDGENEEEEEDDEEFKDDPRDKDFILPDDALNTLKEDLKLSKIVKYRLKDRENQKDPNRQKMVFHSAKKLEDGSYEYCGFRFTGSKIDGYTCAVCPNPKNKNKRFSGIYQHIRTKHINEGGQICPICGKVLSTASGLKAHLVLHEEHDPFICDICGGGYKEERGLELHKSLVHFPNFNHVCHQCGKAYKSIQSLNNHTRRVHEQQKRFFCSECGMGFYCSSGLYRHTAVHLTDRPFACSQCGQTFRRVEHRRRHFKQFHDFKTFGNSRARDNLSKTQRVEARNNKSIEASSSETQDTPQDVSQNAPDENLKCPHCGLQYNRQNNLTRHILQIHKINIKGLNWKSRNKYSPSTTATSSHHITNSEGLQRKTKKKQMNQVVEESNSLTTNVQHIGNISCEQLPSSSSSHQTISVPLNNHPVVSSNNNWNVSTFHVPIISFSSTNQQQRFNMDSPNSSENNNTNGSY